MVERWHHRAGKKSRAPHGLHRDGAHGPHFSRVEEITDVSIERIIVEAKRRATCDFMDHSLSGPVKAIVRVVGVRPVARSIGRLGLVMGYGVIRLVSLRRRHRKGDFIAMIIKEALLRSALLPGPPC